MIEVKNLKKSFDDNIVFQNISFEIKEKEMVAIVGASGSGKSTLLNIIGFIEGDYSGDYYYKNYHNVDVNTKKSQEIIRDEISYIFQNFALIEDWTVRKNLELALKYVKLSKDEKENLMKKSLKYVNMEKFLDKKVATLSGGEQQRVSLSRAILKPSNLILADEPTGSLDDENKDYVMDILKKLNEDGKTVIIVTHDKTCANLCDRKIRL